MHTYVSPPLPYPPFPFPSPYSHPCRRKGVNFSTLLPIYIFTSPSFFFLLLTSYKFCYSLYLSFSSVELRWKRLIMIAMFALFFFGGGGVSSEGLGGGGGGGRWVGGGWVGWVGVGDGLMRVGWWGGMGWGGRGWGEGRGRGACV